MIAAFDAGSIRYQSLFSSGTHNNDGVIEIVGSVVVSNAPWRRKVMDTYGKLYRVIDNFITN